MVGHWSCDSSAMAREAGPNKVGESTAYGCRISYSRSLQGKAAVCRATTYQVRDLATLGLTS